MDLRKCLALHALTMLWLVQGAAQAQLPDPPPLPGAGASVHGDDAAVPARSGGASSRTGDIVLLAPGDQVRMTVFGRPEMETTTYVGGDGKIRVPLAGAVSVGGLSPAEASQRVEKTLKAGQFLVNPQVTLAVVQTLSHISVLGEVRTPGRYPIESTTTVMDALALAGGRSEKGDDVIYLLRENDSGEVSRTPINLRSLTKSISGSLPDVLTLKLQSGDRLFVPQAQQIYISGEVRAPATYRLEDGMTVLQAIAVAGGVTEKGSSRRVEIKRRKPDGSLTVLHPKLTDRIEADDVITIKEKIF